MSIYRLDPSDTSQLQAVLDWQWYVDDLEAAMFKHGAWYIKVNGVRESEFLLRWSRLVLERVPDEAATTF